jgi:hypothetical protein
MRYICLLLLSFNISAIEIVMNTSIPRQEMNSIVAWSIFSGQVKNWSNGVAIQVFILDEADPLHDRFVKETFNTFPYQLRRALDRRIFSGTGIEPTKVNSLEDMFLNVVASPGGIGYLPDKWDGDSVRAIKIQKE